MIASLKLRTYQIRLVWKLGKAISSIADIQLYLAMICSSLTLLLLLISNAMAEVSRWNSHFPISVLIFVWKKDTLLVDFIFLLHKSQRWKQPVSLPQGTSLQQSGRVGQPTKKDFQNNVQAPSTAQCLQNLATNARVCAPGIKFATLFFGCQTRPTLTASWPRWDADMKFPTTTAKTPF